MGKRDIFLDSLPCKHMKPLLCAFILVLLSSCSTVPGLLHPCYGSNSSQKTTLTIIELSLTPWAAGREKAGQATSSSLPCQSPSHPWIVSSIKEIGSVETDTMQLDKAIYTANMREKNTAQKELILDGDSIKEYGNTPPNRVSDQVAIFYRYRNKPQLYIHTKFKPKSRFSICSLAKQTIRRILEINSAACLIRDSLSKRHLPMGRLPLFPACSISYLSPSTPRASPNRLCRKHHLLHLCCLF